MINSKGSVVVSQEGAPDGLPGLVVVPDGGGQGQDALQDPDGYSAGGVAAVGFEVELAFEGVVDGLDDLAQGLEEAGACSFRLAFAGGPQGRDAGGGDGRLEGGAVVVLVTDQGLAGPGGDQVLAGGEHAGQDLALVGFRAGQREGDGQALPGDRIYAVWGRQKARRSRLGFWVDAAPTTQRSRQLNWSMQGVETLVETPP
jgi:hypothetical protein